MDVYECLNQILSTIYTILIIVISSISTPEVSQYVKEFLSSNINKLIVIALVVYLAFNNFVLGVVLTMALYLVLEGDDIVLMLQNANSESTSEKEDNAIDDDAVASSVIEAEISKLKVPSVIAETNQMKENTEVTQDLQIHPDTEANPIMSEDEYIEAPNLELKPINTSIGKVPSVLNPKLVKTNVNNNVTIVTPDVDNIQTNVVKETTNIVKESEDIVQKKSDSADKLTSTVLSNLDLDKVTEQKIGEVAPGKPQQNLKNVKDKPAKLPVNFRKISSSNTVAKIPDPVDNVDYMGLTPLQGQINSIKDIEGIQSNLTRSQRGVSKLEIKNTEPRNLIPTQNLMNVQFEKCNANTPKDCDCNEIKQGGNEYKIDSSSEISGFADNGYFNYQNI